MRLEYDRSRFIEKLFSDWEGFLICSFTEL